jgi:hypothetical protein
MQRRVSSAVDMTMFVDMNGLHSADMSVDMDIGLALAWLLVLLMPMLIFLPALAMGMYGWAGPGFFAADIAADIAAAMATGRLPGMIAAEDLRAAG